ncbi:MAG: glutaredoxin-related protein [Verrucomicrobiales bacterium]|jgi:glutaredoxin-related protein
MKDNTATENKKPEITAYLKTYCGWSEGIRAIMRKHDLGFEEKDIIANPAFRWEMEQKSGQPLSPCVIVDGEMLADVSGEEVETYMLEKGLVGDSDKEADAPVDSACTDEQHAEMAVQAATETPAGKIRFIE